MVGTLSEEIIIAGVPFNLGIGPKIINYRDNPAYSFFDPIGGSCAPTPSEGTGPAIPGMPGSTTPTEDSGSSGRRRYSHRSGLNADDLASMTPEQKFEQLHRVIKQVVVHHDATYTSHDCFTVLCRRGLSTHFMVNHDGGIIQGLDIAYEAWHARGSNEYSIGVDMNNVASIEGHRNRRQDLAFGGAADYTTRETVEGRINRSTKESFVYTEPQYTAFCALLKKLNEVIGFPLIYPQNENGGVVITRLDPPGDFSGFCGHWHVQAGKWDPGPGFDWAKVMEGLHGKTNTWPIDVGTIVLDDLRSEEATDEATRVYFDNNESGPAGGGYPIGLNQEWHDGVHIYAEPGTPIRACAEGDIILTRNGPNFPIGSPNFVLIRHFVERVSLEIDEQGNSEEVTEKIPWYSMYMHLQQMDHQLVPYADDQYNPEDDPEETGTPDPENPEGSDPETTPEHFEVPDWFERLVQLARESKGGESLQPQRDFEARDVRQDPQAFYDAAVGLLQLQERRYAYDCIEDGNPFRWMNPLEEVEEGVPEGFPVGAGDIIGYVGEFGELRGEEVHKRGTFQFQIFSTTPIFDDTRFDEDTWRRVQADFTGDNLVSVPEIVLPVQGIDPDAEDAPTALELGQGRTVTPSDIERFFRSGAESQKHKLRILIACHLSEWDFHNDDSLTANIPILWPWQTEVEYTRWRAHHIGFKWLTDETRNLIGMMEGPVPIYTYHPFYLLGWWALNYGTSLQTTTFSGLDGEALEEAIENEQDEEDFHGDDPEASNVSLDDVSSYFTIHYDHLDHQDPGEWPANVDFEDRLLRDR